MLAIGLTGGVGMGKSTAAQMLSARGVPIVDTDQLARDVVEPGQPALARIKDRFGPEFIGQDGRLRRDLLGQLVFNDEVARKDLETILHPRIAERWRSQVQEWRRQNRLLAVVVIPLLFETGAETKLDVTVCIACSAATQRQRLSARGWSAQDIERRIRAQWDPGQKMVKSDFVIWTEGDLAIHAAQLDRILQAIKDRSGSDRSR